MSGAGRPLRFLGLVLGLWLSARVLMLAFSAAWTAHAPAGAIADARPAGLSDQGGRASTRPPAMMRARVPAIDEPGARLSPQGAPPLPAAPRGLALPARHGWNDRSADALLGASAGFLSSRREAGLFGRLLRMVADGSGRPETIFPGQDGAAPADRNGRRWSATAWLLWRPDSAAGFAQSPLLGGSQAGVRLDYRLRESGAGRLGAYARVSRALTGPSSEEGAIGIAYRPGRLPVSLLAERRQRLGPGGRSGFALLAAGGFGPRAVAPRLEAEGYAQVGVVGLSHRRDGFADGKTGLAWRLDPAGGRPDLAVGASVSGSVQPGASRLDVGPELRLRLPVRGGGGLRLSTEWRERVAGNARPARGPAVTLIAVF